MVGHALRSWHGFLARCGSHPSSIDPHCEFPQQTSRQARICHFLPWHRPRSPPDSFTLYSNMSHTNNASAPCDRFDLSAAAAAEIPARSSSASSSDDNVLEKDLATGAAVNVRRLWKFPDCLYSTIEGQNLALSIVAKAHSFGWENSLAQEGKRTEFFKTLAARHDFKDNDLTGSAFFHGYEPIEAAAIQDRFDKLEAYFKTNFLQWAPDSKSHWRTVAEWPAWAQRLNNYYYWKENGTRPPYPWERKCSSCLLTCLYTILILCASVALVGARATAAPAATAGTTS